MGYSFLFYFSIERNRIGLWAWSQFGIDTRNINIAIEINSAILKNNKPTFK